MKRWFFAAAAAAVAAGGSARADDPAHVTVSVPAGATLTVDGHPTRQMTAVRQFVTPPLAEGRAFTYTLRASFTWYGQPVTKETKVEVRAGARVSVDLFAAPDAPAAPAAKPMDPEPPPRFDPPKPKPPEPEPKPAPKTDDTKPAPKDPPKVDAPKPTPADPPKEPVKEKKDPPAVVAPPPAPAAAKPDPKKPEIEVPFVPTPDAVVSEMLKLAGVKAGDVVYDLGCGDGRIAVAAVKDFKAKAGRGIDFNPERVKESKAAAKKAGDGIEKKLTFTEGDVLKLTAKDFADVDVVTLYLLPEVNAKLKPVLKAGLKPGARVVSHDFDMGADWKPEKTVTVADEEGVDHTVYLWTIPKK